ncbi:MAG: hypothetical protein PHV34_24310, partial [Verrucomicrobiae bacterium]|nr:hypothetical protein [Verrucomicrobiae bacterium]
MAKKLGLEGIEWGLPKYEEAAQAIKEMATLTREEGLEITRVSQISAFFNYFSTSFRFKLWKKPYFGVCGDLLHGFYFQVV